MAKSIDLKSEAVSLREGIQAALKECQGLILNKMSSEDLNNMFLKVDKLKGRLAEIENVQRTKSIQIFDNTELSNLREINRIKIDLNKELKKRTEEFVRDKINRDIPLKIIMKNIKKFYKDYPHIWNNEDFRVGMERFQVEEFIVNQLKNNIKGSISVDLSDEKYVEILRYGNIITALGDILQEYEDDISAEINNFVKKYYIRNFEDADKLSLSAIASKGEMLLNKLKGLGLDFDRYNAVKSMIEFEIESAIFYKIAGFSIISLSSSNWRNNMSEDRANAILHEIGDMEKLAGESQFIASMMNASHQTDINKLKMHCKVYLNEVRLTKGEDAFYKDLEELMKETYTLPEGLQGVLDSDQKKNLIDSIMKPIAKCADVHFSWDKAFEEEFLTKIRNNLMESDIFETYKKIGELTKQYSRIGPNTSLWNYVMELVRQAWDMAFQTRVSKNSIVQDLNKSNEDIQQSIKSTLRRQ